VNAAIPVNAGAPNVVIVQKPASRAPADPGAERTADGTAAAYQVTSRPAVGSGPRRPADRPGSRPTTTYSAGPTTNTQTVRTATAGRGSSEDTSSEDRTGKLSPHIDVRLKPTATPSEWSSARELVSQVVDLCA
jgi:hypothetical protein